MIFEPNILMKFGCWVESFFFVFEITSSNSQFVSEVGQHIDPSWWGRSLHGPHLPLRGRHVQCFDQTAMQNIVAGSVDGVCHMGGREVSTRQQAA